MNTKPAIPNPLPSIPQALWGGWTFTPCSLILGKVKVYPSLQMKKNLSIKYDS
jgi:hypothetical protein